MEWGLTGRNLEKLGVLVAFYILTVVVITSEVSASVCWNQLIIGSWDPITSFPKTLFCDIMLITWNKQWWKHLHIRKKFQKLQIKTSYFPWRVRCLVFISTPQSICICQHSANLHKNGYIGGRGYVSYISITMIFKSYKLPSSDFWSSTSCRMTWRLENARTQFPGLWFILQLPLPHTISGEGRTKSPRPLFWLTTLFPTPRWQVQNFHLSNP